MAIKQEKVVIMNPELDRALKGFIPVIGNFEDLNIVKALEKLYAKLKTIDSTAFRSAQKNRTPLTSKMQEIQREEEALIRRITARNFDF